MKNTGKETVRIENWGRVDVYTVVDKIPAGYKVWNASVVFEDKRLIPLVICGGRDGCHVKKDAMLAFRCKDEETAAYIRSVAHRGSEWRYQLDEEDFIL